uniref:PDZ domain-containing protein n=1 Tax=Aegilops tauschii subsp. strangulata TaxID=200361 RepID=A0A453KV66_AEGTS
MNVFLANDQFLQRGVGGPLMDFDGNIIGMNFYDKKETPFVPGFIMLKCLQHFNDFGRVIRPLHGLRVKTLHEEQLTVLEKIHLVFPGVCGVIVEKVQVPSPEHSEIKVGDIITHVDGIPFSSAAEVVVILFLDGINPSQLPSLLTLPGSTNHAAKLITYA